MIVNLIVLFICSFFFVVGCVSNPELPSLESCVDLNPPPTAIVGLWSTKFTFMSKTQSATILFRKNGTGVAFNSRFQVPISFTYEYMGGGIWKTGIPDIKKYKISKEHLLSFYHGVGPKVFERKPLESIESDSDQKE